MDRDPTTGSVAVPSGPTAIYRGAGSGSLAAQGGLAAGLPPQPLWPASAGPAAAESRGQGAAESGGPGVVAGNATPLTAETVSKPPAAESTFTAFPAGFLDADGGAGRSVPIAESAALIAESTARRAWAEVGAGSPPIPAPQGLQILIDRRERVVARSVEGPARMVFDANQVGLQGARLDLSQARIPVLSINSLRQIEGLALSVLGTAELRQRSRNQAVSGSAIEGSADGGSYRIRALDVLVLGLRGGQGGLIAVDDRVEGMGESSLAADGGQSQTNLEIGADMQLTLGGSAGSGALKGELTLTSTAVNGSTIRLGDGADNVRIASRISRDEAPELFASAPAAPAWGAVAMNSRAVGLLDSQLSTGGGPDLVTIEAGADEAVALENSLVQLGEGDDSLLLRGAVLGSRIEPGEGRNRVEVSGAVDDSVLVLNRGGDTGITLSAADDSLVLEGDGGVKLLAGGGDDRIRVEGRAMGLINGGDGQDTLEMGRSRQPGSPAPVGPQQLELQGLNSGQIDGLRFSSVEAIQLADSGNHVVIAPLGSLQGPLRGGAGADILDYGAWTSGVSVDLGSGTAEAIGGGTPGGAPDFDGVLGGLGADHLVAAADTLWLDGGAGDDWLEFNPTNRVENGASIRLTGGGGRDLFVLAGLDPLLLASSAAWGFPGSPQRSSDIPSPRLLPSLDDLTLVIGPRGELQLSDRLGWLAGGILAASDPAASGLVELLPSGLEGLGQSRRLPIAPLPALLAGIGTGPPQLAIATDLLASQLVLLGPSHRSVELALLPALHGPPSAAGAPLQS